MSEKSIEEIVKECIVQQLGVDADHVKPDASIIDDLGADSLDFVELIMGVEMDLEITISEEDSENIKTVQDLIDAAKKRVGVKA